MNSFLISLLQCSVWLKRYGNYYDYHSIIIDYVWIMLISIMKQNVAYLSDNE